MGQHIKLWAITFGAPLVIYNYILWFLWAHLKISVITWKLVIYYIEFQQSMWNDLWSYGNSALVWTSMAGIWNFPATVSECLLSNFCNICGTVYGIPPEYKFERLLLLYHPNKYYVNSTQYGSTKILVKQIKYSAVHTSLLPFVCLLYGVSTEFVKRYMNYMEMPINA
jgi:hypothetical protein